MNWLNGANDTKFVTRNWNSVNDHSNANYNVGNEIIYITEKLKSNHRNHNDAYILVRNDISIIGHNLLTEVEFKIIYHHKH